MKRLCVPESWLKVDKGTDPTEMDGDWNISSVNWNQKMLDY